MGVRQNIGGKFNATANDGATATINVSYHAAQPSPVDTPVRREGGRVLDTLPLDATPAPSPLPPFSHMPYHPNRQFVGREDELFALARVLKDGGAAIIGQSPVVTGLGGIGKSQLAAECVWRYGRYFTGGVFWLSFAAPDSIPTEIVNCGHLLGLHADFAGLPLDTQIAIVSSHWQDGLPRLLIFDNCEDPELFRSWCPPSGECRVILTSRRAEWPADLDLAAVPLDTLPRAESIALLRKHRPDLAEDDKVLDAIAKELGDFPLALHLAGSYLYRYRAIADGKPANYLEELRRPGLLAHASLTGGKCANGHEANVARTFAASTARLDAADPADSLALAAFAHAAHFAPGEPIPIWLLAESLAFDWSDKDTRCHLADAIARLADLGLVESSEGGPQLHRLIAAFARDSAADTDAARNALETAIAEAANEQNKAGLPGPLLPWQAHLRHAAHIAAAAGSEEASRLLNSLGYHLNMIADLAGARDAFQRALNIDETTFGPDHPNVAICVNNLGVVLQDLGDLAGARDAYQRALDIDEKAFGADHPKIAIRVNNLGSVLQDLGDLGGARDALQRALDIDEKAFGPDHPEVAIDVNNLGGVLKAQGDLDGARAAFLRVLNIDVKAFGPDHPNVAICVNNLGGVLQALGDLAGARAAYQRALDIDEKAFGADHPSVAIRVNNLGSVLRDLGDLAGARAAYQCALNIFERAFGPDHSKTRLVRDNLARLS